ncbi:DUF7289 family protein [Haloarchaeobius sp. DFWS5]|uniref:DUF7289 family protein n=1 Tax=Haloarchaeobius sp. DFWS5 TaxID=3446114 RepID=UPI003EBDF3FA
MTSTTPTGIRDQRGASAIVGLVLLFGLVMVAAGLIFVTSMSATDSVERESQIRNAELSLEEAGAKLKTLSFQHDDSVTSFDLSGKDSDDVQIRQDGQLHFEINGYSKCRATMNLGSIVYENDEGATVAYQAGGVWKQTGDGSVMVSSPDLNYRVSNVQNRTIRTLDFPVVDVTGQIDNDGEVTARKTVNSTERKAFQQSLCLPVSENATVDRVRTITITLENSTYFEAWDRYMSEEFGDAVVNREYYTGNGTVSYTVPLGQSIYPGEFVVEDAEVRAGLWGTGTTKITFKSTGAGTNTLVDSYNSSVNPYFDASGSEAMVVNNGPITVQTHSTIKGDIAADGDVKVLSNSVVDGNISYNGTNTSSGSATVSGKWYNGFEYDGNALPPIDDEIQFTIDSSYLENHNNNTPVFNGSTTDGVRQSGTVETGVYYVNGFDVNSGESVTFDTSSGDVVVAVNGSVDVQGDVTVVGDGQVRVFVDDEMTVGGNVEAHDASNTQTTESNKFWMYGRDSADVTFQTGSRYTGVVYAPGPTGTVSLEAGNGNPAPHSEVFGAIVGGETTVDAGAQLHFDESIRTEPLDSDGDGIPDSADPNNSVADTDVDGVPNYYDDCPDGAKTDNGENGCKGVDEDESRNGIVVNQSKVRINVAGSVVSDVKTVRKEVGERRPLDVVFVMDDSGSLSNSSGETIDSPGEWTEVPFFGGGHTEIPAGEVWQIDYHDGGKKTLTGPDSVYLDSGGFFWNGDEYRKLKLVVPDQELWEVHHNNGDVKTVTEGEVVNTNNVDEIDVTRIGNDPNEQRVDAMRTFIELLNKSNGDKVGVVEFYGDDANVQHELDDDGADFGGAKDSLRAEGYGGTPLEKAVRQGAFEAKLGDNDKKVVVLLTDGVPSYPTTSSDVVEAAKDAAEDDVIIYPVGLGGGTNETLLKKIANVSDGNYTEVDDAEGLEEEFAKIAGNIKEEKINVVEHKNTSVSVNFGGESVVLDNVSVGTDGSDVVESTNIDEIDVGDLLSISAMSYSCENVTQSWYNQTRDDETYGHVTCDGTNGTHQTMDHSSDTYHETFVAGEDVPPSSEFTTGWYKNTNTPLRDVMNDYDPSLMADTDGDGDMEFALDQNDAIIVVRLNHDSEDTDFVVLHLDAYNTTRTYPPVSTDDDDDEDSNERSDTEENSYVVGIDKETIEVGNNDSSRIVYSGSISEPSPAMQSVSAASSIDQFAPALARARPVA